MVLLDAYTAHVHVLKFNAHTCTQDGTAPGAKLAFFDGGDANGGLNFPDSIYDELFMPAYEAGARVHTNSWGVSCNGDGGAGCGYLNYDLQIDEFVYDNNDMVIMYVAHMCMELRV